MTKKKPPATTWKKGQSGNPKGRPPGVPDRRTAMRDALGDDLPAIVQKVVEQAKAGDLRACELVLSRCMPSLRPIGQPAPFPLATDATPSDAARALVQAVADGRIAPDVARQILDGLAAMTRIIEADELEQRLRALEEKS